jgi:hypothetical protein
MEEFYLENFFVFELFSVEAYPIEETSELGFLYNKSILSGFDFLLYSVFHSFS